MLTSTSWDEQTSSGSIIENVILNSVSLDVSGSPKINNNTFCGSNFDGSAVAVGDLSNAVISNNTIDGTENTQSRAYGIRCRGDALISDNVVLGWSPAGIMVDGGSAIIERNLITNNMGHETIGGGGIRIEWARSSPIIQNNTIAQNRIGINLLNGPWPVLENNNIQDNTEYNIYLINNNVGGNPQHDINATYNWWGTTDVSAINQSIYDSKNDYKLGTVNFVPFLTEPNPEAIPIPEFPSWIILLLFITTTLLIIICRRSLNSKKTTTEVNGD